jgi:predicted dithiol-disulfide oxidoreductase (DUF899 family)
MPQRHKVVPHEKWLEARRQILQKEKAFTRRRDRLNRERRSLPWERVDKTYVFEGPDGKETLAQLFHGRRQLVVYHFMFAPEWDTGCRYCSFWADNFDDQVIHLAHRDVTMVAVARAPYRKLAAYKKRVGWQFKWLSSAGNDFNFDYEVSFRPEDLATGRALYNFKKIHDPSVLDQPGVSVFYKGPGGAVFHTYSTYARGLDILNTAYNYLDLVPKGRDEAGHDFPMFWVRRRDEYGR